MCACDRRGDQARGEQDHEATGAGAPAIVLTIHASPFHAQVDRAIIHDRLLAATRRPVSQTVRCVADRCSEMAIIELSTAP
jgi:hypothetical protein